MTRTCPRCKNKGLRMKVNLFLDIDADDTRKLSKKNLARASVRVEGAGWDTALRYCPCCGWIGERGV